MTMKFEKLVKDLKSITGVSGVAITSKDGTPLALHGVTAGEGEQMSFASTTLSDIAKTFEMGKATQTLIMGSNYKILTFEYEEKIVSVFMSPGASMQAVKSKIPSPKL